MNRAGKRMFLMSIGSLMTGLAMAHDPVFGIGPHVMFRDGVEVHVEYDVARGGEPGEEAGFGLKYGLTADWSVGLSIAAGNQSAPEEERVVQGPVYASTKYRFWREDRFGSQESAAVMTQVMVDDGEQQDLAGRDVVLGLTYGFEGRKWYRWLSLRKRLNSGMRSGQSRPDIWLLDAVVGIRLNQTEYLEPDWVWMVELNTERLEFRHQPDTDVIFLSPGLMWTWRNFAIKTGAQFRVMEDGSNKGRSDNYRLKLELEWHL